MGSGYRKHTELPVYKLSFDLAKQIFDISRGFRKEGRYSLTDQILRSSHSVCANLAEAWRKRRYRGAFISKLSDAEADAAETQVWLQFVVQCGYVDRELVAELYEQYDEALAQIVSLIHNTDSGLSEHPNNRHPPNTVSSHPYPPIPSFPISPISKHAH